MDVLLKLRVLIWAFVLVLWSLLVYQYLGEEESETGRMQAVVNPYMGSGFEARVPTPAQPPPAPADPALNVLPPREAAAQGWGGAAPGARAPAGAAGPAPRRASRAWREDRSALPDPPVPPGFVKSATPHFSVYAEEFPASRRFLSLIEALHSNLMLDLEPFSPWARRQRVSLFLFKSQETYQRVTGRPGWSGGASSVPKRKVYVYESEELPGILAHELTHIYFDGFFLEGAMDPLWLSEGMATLVQVERGLAAPDWLRENLALLEAGGGLPIEELVAVASTAGWPDEKVRLWYAQSYSLVRYLVRARDRASFYKFAAFLRRGSPVAESLLRAYGAPYTRLRALELGWRHEISRGLAAPRPK